MLGIVRQPVSGESSLSFSDYGRMHAEEHALRQSRWTPPFALNTSQLRRVLLVRCWRYLHNGTPLPETLDWQELNKAATAHALHPHKIRVTAPLIQKQMFASHVGAVIRAGGYLAYQAAVAYRSWRLGQNSVSVAESLGVSPSTIRITLQRLRNIAAELHYDVGTHHHSFRSKRHAARLRAAWVRRKQTAVLENGA